MYSHHQQHLKNRVIILSRSIILAPTVFSNLLNDFAASNTQVIIVGDFNLDALKYLVNQVTEYIDLLFSFGFLQLIMKPTPFCIPY